MAKTEGRNVQLYKGNTTTGTLVAVARTKTVTINKELIDFTADDSDGWRESSAEAGVRSVDISIEGLVDLAARTFLTDVLAETQDLYTLKWADNSELAGTFNTSNYEESGNHDGETTFSVTLNSSGAVTFTP